MKNLAITLNLILLCFLAVAQTDNNISLDFGKAVDTKSPVLMGDWQHPENSVSFELAYSRIVVKQLSLETGIRYSKHAITTGFDAEPWRPEVKGTLHLISIPVRMKVSFLKYFFGNAGFTFDKDFNRDKLYPFEDQTGIGFEIGLGGKIDIRKISLIINPMYSRHSLIAFNQNDFKIHLGELGVKFGIGYNF